MTDDTEDLTPVSDPQEELLDAETQAEDAPQLEAAEEVSEEQRQWDHQRRGRLITAGIIATVALCLVALLVAGIFQLTSYGRIICPVEPPVNNPARVLWKDITADKVGPRSLGVPDELSANATFKGAVFSAKPSPDTDKRTESDKSDE